MVLSSLFLFPTEPSTALTVGTGEQPRAGFLQTTEVPKQRSRDEEQQDALALDGSIYAEDCWDCMYARCMVYSKRQNPPSATSVSSPYTSAKNTTKTARNPPQNWMTKSCCDCKTTKLPSAQGRRTKR